MKLRVSLLNLSQVTEYGETNDGFLQAIRDVCDEYKSVFIIDEVMTVSALH